MLVNKKYSFRALYESEVRFMGAKVVIFSELCNSMDSFFVFCYWCREKVKV